MTDVNNLHYFVGTGHTLNPIRRLTHKEQLQEEITTWIKSLSRQELEDFEHLLHWYYEHEKR